MLALPLDAHPDAAPAAPVVPAPAVPLRPVEVGRAVLGWIALGAVGLATEPEALATGTAYTVAAPAGAMLLTVPALLVGHQYLNLRASPATLVSTLLLGFVRAGDVALGLVPLALLFSATSDLGPVVTVLGLLGASFQGLLVTMRRLNAAEAGCTEAAEWAVRGRMQLLVIAWAGLYALIGLRLTWNLLAAL